MNPLMARVESTRMATHCHDTGFFLRSENFFSVRQRISNWNLNLHVFARAHALHSLLGVNLCRGCQNDGIKVRASQRVIEICCPVRDSVFFSSSLCGLGRSAV